MKRTMIVMIALILVALGMTFLLTHIDRLDNIRIIENLPSIVQKHGHLVSVAFTGQQKTVVLKDPLLLNDVESGIVGSEFGRDVPENRFYSYKMLLVFSDGATLNLNASVSSLHIILNNDYDDDTAVARTLHSTSMQSIKMSQILKQLTDLGD